MTFDAMSVLSDNTPRNNEGQGMVLTEHKSQWSRRSPEARARTLAILREHRRTRPEIRERNRAACKKWRDDNLAEVLKKSAARRAATPKNVLLWLQAKTRAKKKGVPFTIEAGDISVPEYCPILGLPLVVAVGRRGAAPNSMSLDRIVPSKGYVPGNIQVISHRANTLKSNSTIEEIEALYKHTLRLRDQGVRFDEGKLPT